VPCFARTAGDERAQGRLQQPTKPGRRARDGGHIAAPALDQTMEGLTVSNRPTSQAATRPQRATAAEKLSTQARALYADVVARCGHVGEQLLLLGSLARRHVASSADVEAVRERLLAGHTRECER
jgi:hypothetical protein